MTKPIKDLRTERRLFYQNKTHHIRRMRKLFAELVSKQSSSEVLNGIKTLKSELKNNNKPFSLSVLSERIISEWITISNPYCLEPSILDLDLEKIGQFTRREIEIALSTIGNPSFEYKGLSKYAQRTNKFINTEVFVRLVRYLRLGKYDPFIHNESL
ncbi:MAG: hypothetical protein QNJ31_05290 [Candidatus Caenarcaniphilales bacterium]|nr:hypothetical protein [Candidatus Caenarcaniphilales bacterium]